MDELIEEITMNISMSEDNDDSENAAFFTNILGRIRRHESELATLRMQLAESTDLNSHLELELSYLEPKLADSQKDAARYQYLFDDSSELNVCRWDDWYEGYDYAGCKDNVDIAIDAALQKDQSNEA